ncbi:MAG: shikimate kinase [Planctomycetaceae bacterium]
MPVTLIGYRGCGKSTVGPLLAERLGWAFVDADEQIERRAGRSVQEIFTNDGEPEFRRLERVVMSELLSQERTVIAAGGGAILDADTRSDLRRSGPVVWLRAGVETLVGRIAGDPSTGSRRPDLTVDGGREEIDQLLSQRTPLYSACATHVVDSDGDPADVVEQILAGIAEDVGGMPT